MTIDEAIIKHIQIADSYHKAMPNYDEAADHRQIAEWLTELKEARGKIADMCRIMAIHFGSPCNFSPLDELMLERGNCDDCCGKIRDAECWSRYFQVEIQAERDGIEDNTNKMYAEIKELKVKLEEAKRLLKSAIDEWHIVCEWGNCGEYCGWFVNGQCTQKWSGEAEALKLIGENEHE